MHIGFFDSGIGGATVARKVLETLPNYSYVYYADDSNMPYGEKEADAVYSLSIKALRHLFEQKCTLVIIACNTATSILRRIQQEWLPKNFPDRKVLGVIRPTVECMTANSQDCGELFILATPRTVKSKAYDHELNKLGLTCAYEEIACKDLAQAIEQSTDLMHDTQVNALCREYLAPVPLYGPATIYTACTHYELVRQNLMKIRPNANIVCQSSIVAQKLKQYLCNHPEIENGLSKVDKKSITIQSSSSNPTYILKLESLVSK